MRRQSKNPLPTIKRKAWGEFSKFVRRRDGGVCFTCGIRKPPEEMHAGHFIHNRLDFDETNVHCQCPQCNTFLHGNLGIYAIKMIELYGKEVVDGLLVRSNQVVPFRRDVLEGIYQKYKKLNEGHA